MTFSQSFPFVATPLTTQEPTYGPDLAVRLICPDCRDPHPNIIEEFSCGDLVCGDCGLVLAGRIVDTRPEWRTFAGDEGDDPCRVGAASEPLFEGMEQLDTLIGLSDGGSGVARELKRAAARSRHSRSERNLFTAFREIGNWCDQFSLPRSIGDIAKQLYKRIDEEKLLRGKPIEAVIAACILIACRLAHVPRTFREICELTRVSKKTLGQCYKALERASNLSPSATTRREDVSGPSTGPETLLARYCNHLDLPVSVQSICSDIIVAARQHGIADGRSPVSIAGGAIYFTCLLMGKPKSAREISAVAGVGEGTIKLVYKLYYYQEREKLVREEWIKSGKVNLDNLPTI